MSERWRWVWALLGVAYWISFPIVLVTGGFERRRFRCAGRDFTGEFDDCFNDYLPIVEMLFPLVIWALTYGFARFCFAILAPAPEHRTLGWRLAGSAGGGDYKPAIQIVATFGLGLALLCLSQFPAFHIEFAWYYAFWLGWSIWFLVAILASWRAISSPG